jgi:outer membrane protein assembly factor BamB
MNKGRVGRSRNRVELLVTVGIPVVLALAGGAAIAFWVRGSAPPASIQARVPLPEPATTAPAAPAAAVPTQAAPAGPAAAGPATTSTPSGTTVSTGAAASNVPGYWPWFRGPNRDNISPENVRLARSWPPGGPRVIWSRNLGEGYAAPAIRDGRLYLLDWDNGQDVLRCLSFADGKDLWRYSYPDPIKRNHGMSRTVPAVTDKYVVTFGPSDVVTCAEAASGKILWQIDLVKQYGAKVPDWYAGQCPLIEGDRVILAPAGRILMIAVDMASGKVIWQTANTTPWKQSHASICAADIGGKHQYIYAADGGVVSVDAANGQVLWQTGEWRVSTATIPTAISIGDGRVFLTGGYNAGSLMIKVSAGSVQALYRLNAATFSSKQQTPILQNGYLYGVLESGELACIDLNGKVQWKSGPTQRFGLGPFVMAPGGLMYLLNDTGTLTLAEVSPSAYRPLASAKVLNGTEAWGPLALTAGKLVARDLTKMVCLEVAG